MHLNESVLKRYATNRDLGFVRDPFHGSNGFEFIRRRAGKVEAVGFLYSADTVEVYRRFAGRLQSWVHENLWFIEPVLKPFLKKVQTTYEALDQVPLQQFDETKAIALADRYIQGE